jgi:type VI secretion system protein ImpG
MLLDLVGDTHFTTPSGAPVHGVRCVAGPTTPYGVVRDGEDAWSLISHLSQNYLALSNEANGGDALREILRLCSKRGDPQLQRELDGVRGVAGASIVRPLPRPGPRQFARGIEVTLTCEERAFGGQRAFLLAAVLSEFFAKHASTHSFTETVLRTAERGEVYRWPAVAGLRGTL